MTSRADVSPFVVHVLDQLRTLGEVVPRKMFGATCLFVDGTVFAMVDDGVLFFKVNDATRPAFETAGGRPFTYAHKTKGAVAMSYWTIPDADVDSASALLRWGRLALSAATAALKRPRNKAVAKGAAQTPAVSSAKERATSVVKRGVARSTARKKKPAAKQRPGR